jgi:tRNA (guanine10-N2)-dimethyltransferase
MAQVTKLFFHVSGENNSLPYAEIEAILEAERLNFQSSMKYPQLLCIEADVRALSTVINRSSYTRTNGVAILKCNATEKAIIQSARGVSYRSFLKQGQTFSVKIRRVGGAKINALKLEAAIGRIILQKVKEAKVNLGNPDVCFFGVASPIKFMLGKKYFETSRRYLKRPLKNRPFAHPSSMDPKLARTMINLARVKKGDVVLDPFCGSGSILIEGASMGLKMVGTDIDLRMLRGARRNLRHFSVPYEGVIVSDARCLSITNFNHVVTDPPYGRGASTRGVNTRKLINEFLLEALTVLPKGGFVSIALPSTIPTREVLERLGNHCVEEHLLREHKSLTRKIMVIKKA